VLFYFREAAQHHLLPVLFDATALREPAFNLHISAPPPRNGPIRPTSLIRQPKCETKRSAKRRLNPAPPGRTLAPDRAERRAPGAVAEIEGLEARREHSAGQGLLGRSQDSPMPLPGA